MKTPRPTNSDFGRSRLPGFKTTIKYTSTKHTTKQISMVVRSNNSHKISKTY